MSTPTVCIIILNWNRREDTLDCLASLEGLEYASRWTLVVDNGSTDGSVEAIESTYPTVEVIRTGDNLGYAEGNNVGLREALKRGADYALVLNNDTLVAPEMLAHLVAAAEADERVGAAGPTIYFHEDPDVVWSAGGRFDWQRGKPLLRGLRERDEGQFSDIQAVDYVPGSAILMRRSTLEQVGGFEPRYFLYYEDNDWCLRVQRHGYTVVHVPQARLWHKVSLAHQLSSPYISYYHARNRLLFLKMAGAGLGIRAKVVGLDLLRTLASWSLLPRNCHRRAQRDALWAGLCDYRKGHFGPYERWHDTGWISR